MNKLGICVTFNPLFTHIFQLDNSAFDLKKIAEVGYKGIELSIGDIKDIDWKKFDYDLNKNNLELITIATGLIRVVNKVSLIDDDRKSRNEAIFKLINIIHHISRYKSSSKNILIGYVKGSLSNDIKLHKKQLNILKDSLCALLEEAEKKKINIVLEIINHNDSNFLYNIEDGINFISGFKSEFLKLAIDTYHMSIDEKNIVDSIKTAGNNIGYVHLSDHNRGYPGSGNIDFNSILKTLKEINYKEYITLEFTSFQDKFLSISEGYGYIIDIKKKLNYCNTTY